MFTQNNRAAVGRKKGLTLREMCLFAMLGTMMFCSKIIMELLPNIHLLGMFTMVFTVAFGHKALVPIYVFVFITGLYAGFAPWWVPYLYIWTVLWAVTMLIPKNLSPTAAMIVYPAICALHGFSYGVLYAPAQALLFNLNFTQALTWIAGGFYFDLLHGVGNLFSGMLILPLSELLKKLYKK